MSVSPSDSKADSTKNVTKKIIMTARAASMSKGFFDGELCDSVLAIEVIDLDRNGQQRRPAMRRRPQFLNQLEGSY